MNKILDEYKQAKDEFEKYVEYLYVTGTLDDYIDNYDDDTYKDSTEDDDEELILSMDDCDYYE